MYRDVIISKINNETKERDISTTYAEILIGRAFMLGTKNITKEDNAIVIETSKVRHELIYLGFDYEAEKALETNERESGLYW